MHVGPMTDCGVTKDGYVNMGQGDKMFESCLH